MKRPDERNPRVPTTSAIAEPPTGSAAVQPPVAPRRTTTKTLHGEVLEDHYAWLHEKESAEVIGHLEAENRYTESVTAHLRPLEERLYAEMLARVVEDDETVPHRRGNFEYWSRTEHGKQYPILFRRRRGGDEATLTLDLNALAEGQPFLALGDYEVSDDGRILAYSLDTSGFRQYRLRLLDLESRTLLPDSIDRVTDVAWCTDGSFLYVVEDDAKRPFRLLRHLPGDPDPDPILFEEADPLYRLGLGRSRDGKTLVVASASSTTSEIRLLDARSPLDPPLLVEPRRENHEYDVEPAGELLYIRTNDGAKEFRVAVANLSSPGRELWRELVPERAGTTIEGLDAFSGHLVLHEKTGGLPRLRVVDLTSRDEHLVDFPEPAYTISGDSNRVFDTPLFRFRYQSPITPASVFEWDMSARELRLLKRTEVPGWDPNAHVVERLFATAPDGVAIPITLVRRKDIRQDGTAPLLLTGYGAYGLDMPASFSVTRPSLLDRGVVCALAHVRGGGEFGEAWHDAGKMESKPSSFSDLVACAEGLSAVGWCSRERIAIKGGSAGGLLVCAATNLRPDLFRCVVASVPFVDVINTMLDESLPLTVGEFLEWGNPKRPEHYAVMRSYCPYQNLRRADYPSMLILASLHDSQVMYWEPAKYVAKMRSLRTDERPLLLRTNLSAGHHGASGRYDSLKELAFELAFVLWQLEVEAAPG